MIEEIMMTISFIAIFFCGFGFGLIIADKLNSNIIEGLMSTEETQSRLILKLGEQLKELSERNEKYEHELTSIDGLYVADNPEFKNSWRLDFKEILGENGGENG